MGQNIDFSKLTPIESMFGEDFEQTQELVALFEEAELYLSSFSWCERIKKAYFGLGVSAVIGIFLFEIEHSEESADSFHWVVSGDVPSACIAAADCPNPAFVLHKYVGELKNACRNQNFSRTIALLDRVILNEYKDELA